MERGSGNSGSIQAVKTDLPRYYYQSGISAQNGQWYIPDAGGAWQQREYVPFYSYYCPEARGVRDIDDEEIDKSAFAEVLR